jgi:hypothetical protein
MILCGESRPFSALSRKKGLLCEAGAREVSARHRLARANEAFSEGEHLLGQKSYMGAVNRFYHAAFYTARALLAMGRKRGLRQENLGKGEEM